DAAANSAAKLASSVPAAPAAPGSPVGAPAPRSACRIAATSIVENAGASEVPRHRPRAAELIAAAGRQGSTGRAQTAGPYEPHARALGSAQARTRFTTR